MSETKRGGRVAGTPNKTTKTCKENIMAVFNGLGGTSAMKEWAMENKTEFYRMYAKLLPLQVTGEGGGPLQVITEIRREIVENADN